MPVPSQEVASCYVFDVFELLILPFDLGPSILNFSPSSVFNFICTYICLTLDVFYGVQYFCDITFKELTIVFGVLKVETAHSLEFSKIVID